MSHPMIQLRHCKRSDSSAVARRAKAEGGSTRHRWRRLLPDDHLAFPHFGSSARILSAPYSGGAADGSGSFAREFGGWKLCSCPVVNASAQCCFACPLLSTRLHSVGRAKKKQACGQRPEHESMCHLFPPNYLLTTMTRRKSDRKSVSILRQISVSAKRVGWVEPLRNPSRS